VTPLRRPQESIHRTDLPPVANGQRRTEVRVIYASVTETNQLGIVTREVVAAARESLVIGVMSRAIHR
jgi:hypothetical protein